MARKPSKQQTDKKTYLLELADGGQKKITVPASWKITFGPIVIPKGKDHNLGAHVSTVALRFYEGNKENQRAVFTNVKGFRDLDIEISEKRVQVKRETVTKQTQQGARDYVAEMRVEEWVNPDKEDATVVPPEFASLPKPPGNEDA
jgi:hypothetical protein